MEHSEDLENMPTFKRRMGDIVSSGEEDFDRLTGEWADLIKKQYQKGLIPLFITGAGVSVGVGVPDIAGIINMLTERYENSQKDSDVDKLFEIQEDHEKNHKKDRSIVARLLNAFQEKEELRRSIWKGFNEELLSKILKPNPPIFHQKLAELYDKFNAVCLTLNFDGLLIREFVQFRRKDNERAFSLPLKEECERFFLRNSKSNEQSKKEFLEIQIRGDILYVTCDAKGYCPQKGEERSIWASIASYIVPTGEGREQSGMPDKDELLKCPACGEQGVSLLSFPGSYDKEKDMQEMLKVVWKYLAFSVSSVTVVGMSGEWDPLMVAFLGDLLSEREILLLVVDKNPEVIRSQSDSKKEATYIIRELVKPKIHNAIALGVGADDFMEVLTQKLANISSLKSDPKIELKAGATDDKYWYKLIDEIDTNQITAPKKEKIEKLSKSVNREFSDFENTLRNKLQEEGLNKFAQLGLKSYWLGIKSNNSKYHTRYHHSLGVMKIASYLYDRAIEKSGLKEISAEKQFLRLAALLHDIGHLPFSHLIESIFNELNWKPAGYKGYYSHLFQTDEKIEELFKSDDPKQKLAEISYSVTDLINLVNGRFGVGYLDAIINSPLDADKIDYIFRDTDSTNRKISLSPIQFLDSIVADLNITPEGYLAFSGVSAKAAIELLQTRKHLYQNLYLQPGIIVLEGIVKLIIKTYFVHFLELDNRAILDKMDFSGKDYPDLGDYKISYCIGNLQDLLKKSMSIESDHVDNLELEIVKLMFTKIKEEKRFFNDNFFRYIEEGFDTIMNTNNEDELKALESKIVHRRFNRQQEKGISEIVRDVMFRMPGAAIIEVSKSRFLSTPDSRKERERSDGTKTFVECILMPDENYELWTTTSKASKSLHDSSLKNIPEGDIIVYLYPLSGNPDDSYFKQTLNLFEKLLDKKGIPPYLYSITWKKLRISLI